MAEDCARARCRPLPAAAWAGGGQLPRGGGHVPLSVEFVLDTVRLSALAAGLRRWRKPHAVHDPAKVVLDLEVALALGEDCLADIALLRAAPAVFGHVVSDPTMSRVIDALAAECSGGADGDRHRPGLAAGRGPRTGPRHQQSAARGDRRGRRGGAHSDKDCGIDGRLKTRSPRVWPLWSSGCGV